MIAWLIARPLHAAALALTLALAGWHFQDKISDLWDGRKIERLETQVLALQADNAALELALERAKASAQAADEARERNDTKIPEIRDAAKARVDRAPTADAVVSLQDDNAALEAFAAADRALRGTRPN